MGEVTAVVGIGGMGTTVLEVFTQKFAKEAAATGISMRTVAVNRPQDSLDQAQAQKKIALTSLDIDGVSEVDDDQWQEVLDLHAGEIHKAVEGTSAVVVLSGLGGFTGSSVAPFVAEIGKQLGAQVSALVTMPIPFEGEKRAQKAAVAHAELSKFADQVVTVSGAELLDKADLGASLDQAFGKFDEELAAKAAELIEEA
ncbi:hypothetical protein [Gleimia europaea]|uniref:hypothetical protein n=1 Tax=Gleimia europaea TaxID=66228 RepID=UPI000C80446C|nr:hypothetical protein [Gleimia europaea]WIK62020.1 hypothetical protein CJ185_005670 [Gleimia europaea]